ncbi:Zip1p KNAG_0F03390 [Huiozyma naganishii CBS 8797]|uniref:Uncharacterized protein n=1 Tax=Huiozyma naganishii (strain ATCC MYA-139 / BCRC 22969 / CBS 8797 / KCTC 17520 / NBRC 10181 / NCYC 3082 / Yp74L-3) TaxID=1071383 RepID=J7R827_HUIN7|nr:hypothetical protein KNAG_0F03390 [Kazachstania naganishii CBS 8797]CCK71000.1 hypothetical protein KNAG_0F03390 [Kazachstania naganishii CBS 8797]
MSNFFRDTSLGFKPRPNIFSKLRVKEPSSEQVANFNQEGTITDDENDSSMMSFMNNHNTMEHTTLLEMNTPADKNRHATESTPKKPANDLSDDFEITEVRKIEESTESKAEPASEPKLQQASNPYPHGQSHEASSNDVLLEAFTNTQRICSNLKQELQAKHNENVKLKGSLQNYQTDIKKLQDKFEQYHRLLSSLQEKATSLQQVKNTENSKLRDLTADYDTFKGKITEYKGEISSLHTKFNELQTAKRDCDTELLKRTKEIEYLQRELDDYSGQLSEEKIKNGNIFNSLHQFKSEFKTFLLDTIGDKPKEFMDTLLSLESRVQDTIDKQLSTQLRVNKDDTQKCITDMVHIFDEKYDQVKIPFLSNPVPVERIATNTFYEYTFSPLQSLQKRTLQNIREIKDHVGNAIEDSSIKSATSIINSIDAAKKETTEQLLNHGSEFQQSSAVLLEKLATVSSYLENAAPKRDEKTQGLILELSSAIEGYQTKLTFSKEYEETIKGLEAHISSLEQQITENMSALGSKDAQYEETIKQMEEQKIELSQLRTQETGKMEENVQLIKELEQCKAENKRITESLKIERANFDNKLISQNGINSVLVSENDTLKQRVLELEDYRQNVQRDQTNRLDKFQKINEQLQKLNVESVQLKARGLELEEENRNLRKDLENSTSKEDDNAQEVQSLRNQMLNVNAEKQEVLLAKYKLEDDCERLRSNIEKMRHKINTLQEEQKRKVSDPETKENVNIAVSQQCPKSNQFTGRVKKTALSLTSKRSGSMKAGHGKLDTSNSIDPFIHHPDKPTSQYQDDNQDDEFDLPSSSNDDLELTNPSPIYIKPANNKFKSLGSIKQPSIATRKKLLLVDEYTPKKEDAQRKRKRKRV